MSESIEMYLVVTALERKENKPVPLSVLAERLAISAVSANEMCHKLAERGLVEYQPYKGVKLTEPGEQVAQRVLRRRYVWETFLVDTLGITAEEAADIACQLEHITSDKLMDALTAYVSRPQQSPPDDTPATATRALAGLLVGQRARVVATSDDAAHASFLQAQGLAAGSEVEVLAVGHDGSVLLGLAGGSLSLVQAVARSIRVEPLAG